jgi:hypothetical protein
MNIGARVRLYWKAPQPQRPGMGIGHAVAILGEPMDFEISMDSYRWTSTRGILKWWLMLT